MALSRYKIEKFLKNPVCVRVYDTIDSTNNEAKRRAEADRGVTLFVTDCQTAGRGRRGHDFYSPKGSGLYFTLSLPADGACEGLQLITCAAAVAGCEAIEVLTGRHPQVKWVNDIYLGGRKVAGILTELVLDTQNRPLRVIVGIGVNLTTQAFPAEFAARAGCIGDVDPNRLCAEITDRLIEWYEAIYYSDSELKDDYNSSLESSSTVNSLIEKYSRLNLCLGKEVRFSDSDGEHTARAVGIANDGSLIVSENGKKRSLHSGEISITI